MSEATRILVVDDHPKIRAAVRRGLAFEGYREVEAATGEEGLEKAREHLPDLVVLDVMLPGIDGLEVTRRLRSTGAPRHALPGSSGPYPIASRFRQAPGRRGNA